MTTVDVLVRGRSGDTVLVVVPKTPAAREWIDANVEADPIMWTGSALYVEHRFVGDIANGMTHDGLKLRWLS